MKTMLRIKVEGVYTRITLDDAEWLALREISQREKCTVHELVTLIWKRKSEAQKLPSAIGVFIMLYFRAATTEDGHVKAGHGDFNEMKRRAKI